MTKYYVSSQASFGGYVEFIFNASGTLVFFSALEAKLDEEQLKWFANISAVHSEFIETIKAVPKLKLQQITTEVTFDMMWNRYDDKLSSSKKRAQIKWERMSKAEQLKAYNYVYTYVGSLAAGIRKKYLETYLNSELWNNG